MAYSHPDVNAGNRTYNLKKLKEEYPHLSVLKDSTINLKDVKVILGQDCYHLHRAIGYRKCSQMNKMVEFVKECQVELHEYSRGNAMYRRHSCDLSERNQPYKDNASDGAKAVKMSFCRRHDVELKEKMPDKIIPNDSENRNNWLGNGNSGMDAVAQANPNVHTQLSTGQSKQFEKRAWKFQPISIRLHGRNESAQLNTTGILYAKIVIDEFTGAISLMETPMGSSKARTLTSSENGPFIGPAVSWEEMMTQLQFFGKWNKEEIRQLEVNDLVWIVDENVKRAHYKMGRVLEVFHGSDGRVRSALVKTEDGKLKRPVVKLASMFYESVFREKNRAGNVGASHQKEEEVDLELLVEKQELKTLRNLDENLNENLTLLNRKTPPSRDFLYNY